MNDVAALVHGDLVRLARRVLRRHRGSTPVTITLDPASLVNETFVKLLQQRKRWVNREHFFAIATRIMLRVLADYDRARRRGKRAGTRVHLSLDRLAGKRGAAPAAVGIPAVASALEKLEATDPRAARVAKLRLLWGFDNDEIAEVLGISRSSVDRDWRFARAWLVAKL